MVNGKIDARDILAEKPAFNGNIQIKPFNLRKLAGSMDIELPEMADNGTLENIAQRVTEQNFQGPAVTIVGEVVNKRHKINLSLLSQSTSELGVNV
jgi:hypothetical protein